MGYKPFMLLSLGRTPEAAFEAAREEAFYWHGHSGKTGTIAEKTEFRFVGELSSAYLDRLEWYFVKSAVPQSKGGRVPKPIRQMVVDNVAAYADPAGPAVCFLLKGTRVPQIRAAKGRAKTRDKVFIFLGRAESH